MSEQTLSAMNDARDVEDGRLLGEHELLAESNHGNLGFVAQRPA
jgi:hypothetical protein